MNPNMTVYVVDGSLIDKVNLKVTLIVKPEE